VFNEDFLLGLRPKIYSKKGKDWQGRCYFSFDRPKMREYKKIWLGEERSVLF
jgi:hypothetical protein